MGFKDTAPTTFPVWGRNYTPKPDHITEVDFCEVPFTFMVTENVEVEFVFIGTAVLVDDGDEVSLSETKGVTYTQSYQHETANKHLEHWTPLNGCIKDEFKKIKGFQAFWDALEIEMLEAAANMDAYD
jgi:hypothetical protein